MDSKGLQQARRHGDRAVVLIGLAYAMAGVLWVLASDTFVEQTMDTTSQGAAQRYKGLGYIALTTLGLVLLMRWGQRRMLAVMAKAIESDRQLQDIFATHPRPMWVYDRESLNFLHVNEAALDTYGRSRDWFLSHGLPDVLVPEEVPLLRQALQTRRAGHQLTAVFRHVCRDGQVAHIRQTEQDIVFDDRPAVLVTTEDVTNEMLARQAVELREAQLRQLHANLGEVLWLADARGETLLYISPAFDALTGQPTSVLGRDPRKWLALIHPDDRSQGAEAHRRLLADGTATASYRIVRPDGSHRWVEDRRCVIRTDDGGAVLTGGVVEDITDRKAREDERAGLQNRLAELVAVRTQELEEANLELQAFSHTAAHDLKSPLHGIAGMGYVLRTTYAEALGAEGAEMAAHIERAANDMGELVDDLLRLSNVGSARPRFQSLDLVPLAVAVVADLRVRQPHRRVAVLLPDRLEVHADPGLMRSLLLNLLGNAWKFTAQRDEGHIAVSFEQKGEVVEVCVADNGAGFDMQRADRLFQPFQRMHTQGQFRGTGLGLVTCRRILQKHGGDIWLESRPDMGTRVFFTLPVPPPEGRLRNDDGEGYQTVTDPVGL